MTIQGSNATSYMATITHDHHDGHQLQHPHQLLIKLLINKELCPILLIIFLWYMLKTLTPHICSHLQPKNEITIFSLLKPLNMNFMPVMVFSTYPWEASSVPPDGIFPSDDELDALIVVQSLSLTEEAPSAPSEEGVIYTSIDIVPYEHVYPLDNDDQGEYLDIHYITSYVGVISPSSMLIPSR